jgi:hypothetical protein
MSARPGRIEEIVPVPMARPRSSHLDSVEGSAEFRNITIHLWTQLRGMQVDRPHAERAEKVAAGS